MKWAENISGPADGRAPRDPQPDWDPLQACLKYFHHLRRERRPVAPPPQNTSVRLAEFAGRISAWAQAGTRAAGAMMALAMPSGEIVCLGRSGAAPEPGARLDRSAGISGKCVRTGEPYLCRDTASDPWADSPVCAAMGIRSIAMVTLRRHGCVYGLLGVFSDQPAHFDQHHLGTLRYLEGVIAEELDHIFQP